MAYQVLTTLILVLHFGYLGYLVAGGLLAWRWPRTIWLHALAAGWAVAIVAFRLTCPLTWAEDWSRRRAGEPGLTIGFIDRYVEGVLYPERYAVAAQLLVALLVVGSWLGLLLRRNAAGGGPQPTPASGGPQPTPACGGTRATKAGNPRSRPLP